MPDPLLTMVAIQREFAKAAGIAQNMGATLSQEGCFILLRCQGLKVNEMKLARIDCKGYPARPLDVQFLDPNHADPVKATSSANKDHWPCTPPPLERGGRLHLCLAGTRSWLELHGNSAAPMSLNRLVGTLIVLCRGGYQQVQTGLRR